MVQNSLVEYIREQIRAGYSAGEIKGYLTKYGYSESQINEAFQFAYPPTEVKHVITFSKRTIALIIAIICTLVLSGAGVYMFVIKEKPDMQLLDVQMDVITSTVNQVESLKFTAQIFNLGKSKRFDVFMKYEVYDNTERVLAFKEETLAVETRASSTVNIGVGDIKPGNYYVRAVASYGGKKARATNAFRIQAAAEPSIRQQPDVPKRSCPSSCEDKNKCTTDYCSADTGYQCEHSKVAQCCGNGLCENGEDSNSCLEDCASDLPQDSFGDRPVWEQIDIIGNIAKNDKPRAIADCKKIEQASFRFDCMTKVAAGTRDESVCDNIEDEPSRDSCIKEVAVQNEDSTICAKMVKDSRRDQCYMDFATKGEYSVCEKLTNMYLKQSCESL